MAEDFTRTRPQLSVTVPPLVKEWLEGEAKRRDMPVSRLLARYLTYLMRNPPRL